MEILSDKTVLRLKWIQCTCPDNQVQSFWISALSPNGLAVDADNLKRIVCDGKRRRFPTSARAVYNTLVEPSISFSMFSTSGTSPTTPPPPDSTPIDVCEIVNSLPTVTVDTSDRASSTTSYQSTINRKVVLSCLELNCQFEIGYSLTRKIVVDPFAEINNVVTLTLVYLQQVATLTVLYVRNFVRIILSPFQRFLAQRDDDSRQ